MKRPRAIRPKHSGSVAISLSDDDVPLTLSVDSGDGQAQVWVTVYSSDVVDQIVESVGLPISDDRRRELGADLHGAAMQWAVDAQIDARQPGSTDKRANEAWREFIAVHLADVFQRTFNRKASANPRGDTGQVDGPFVRFVDAAVQELPGQDSVPGDAVRYQLKAHRRKPTAEDN